MTNRWKRGLHSSSIEMWHDTPDMIEISDASSPEPDGSVDDVADCSGSRQINILISVCINGSMSIKRWTKILVANIFLLQLLSSALGSSKEENPDERHSRIVAPEKMFQCLSAKGTKSVDVEQAQNCTILLQSKKERFNGRPIQLFNDLVWRTRNSTALLTS